MEDGPLRILVASPAWWPARAFGGPVVAARELVGRLTQRGHAVEVVTTTLLDVGERPSRSTWASEVDGATVHYLGTPVRYRWMGAPPSLPGVLRDLARPDVVHVHGFRDPVTTWTEGWAHREGIPTVFEPLGMLRARLRKVALKKALDAALFDRVARRADAVVVVSEREARDVEAKGIPRDRVVVRGLGFPDPADVPRPDGSLRRQLGIGADVPLAVYVGRIASGKGIEHLVAAARALPDLHVALIGPDDRHASMSGLHAELADAALAGRVRLLGATSDPPIALVGEADVAVAASEGDSFGLAAAEALAAGVPLVVSDRCGITGFLREGEALVVPYAREAVVAAIERVLREPGLAAALRAGGRVAASRCTWEQVTDVQERVYRDVVAAARTASRNAPAIGA